MSFETAEAFIQHIDTNQAYESVIDAFDTEAGTWNLSKLVEHGKAAGFDFSGEDMQALIDQMPGSELNDDDLDDVAGGITLTGGSLLCSVLSFRCGFRSCLD